MLPVRMKHDPAGALVLMRRLLGNNPDSAGLKAPLWTAGLSLEEANQVIQDLRMVGAKCPYHRRYQGLSEPERDCPNCQAIFEARQRLERGAETTGEWARNTILDQNEEVPEDTRTEPALQPMDVANLNADKLAEHHFSVEENSGGQSIIDRVSGSHWFLGADGSVDVRLKRAVELATLLGITPKGFRLVPEDALREAVEEALGHPKDEYAWVPMKAWRALADALGVVVPDA